MLGLPYAARFNNAIPDCSSIVISSLGRVEGGIRFSLCPAEVKLWKAAVSHP